MTVGVELGKIVADVLGEGDGTVEIDNVGLEIGGVLAIALGERDGILERDKVGLELDTIVEISVALTNATGDPDGVTLGEMNGGWEEDDVGDVLGKTDGII